MSTNMDDSTVRQVAHLARLRVSDAEVARFAGQLGRIFHYVEQLNELDTSQVPPTAHASAVTNVFRDDVEHVPVSTEQALANAPDQRDGFFKVPKVLDQESA